MNANLFPTPADLSLPQIMARFPDEAKAIEYFEAIRWADGIVCPHCGNNDQSRFWKITAKKEIKARVGLRQCAECKKQFRVTVGTIFEDSHIPLNLWIIAWYIMAGAKKGVSAKQLQRHLGLGSYKSAWFMAHRIRHAMQDPVFEGKLSGTVEVDETYVGGKLPRGKGKVGRPGKDSHKVPVVSLVERGGNKRSMAMRITPDNLKAAVVEHVQAGSTVVTDAFPMYHRIPKEEFTHHIVNHKKGEYARREGDMVAHTNTVEGSFSLLKRGIVGAFHHVSKKHLHRYLAEFDFRWNHRKVTDGERTVFAMQKASGKRLMMKTLTRH